MYSFAGMKRALDFLISCSIIASFFLNIFSVLVGFSFFFVVFVGGVLCLFYLYDTCLWFCLFWACESVEFLWRAGSYFLSVWGSAVWTVGPVLFI